LRYPAGVISDTDPKTYAIMLEGYRKMSPAQKFARIQALNETVLQMAAARIKKQYSPSSDRELRLRLAALWLDRSTMIRAFGWDPDQQGR
jgi:hypothetical protein